MAVPLIGSFIAASALILVFHDNPTFWGCFKAGLGLGVATFGFGAALQAELVFQIAATLGVTIAIDTSLDCTP